MATEQPSVSPPRTIVVQKYGGSSVADVDRLGRVADRVVATRRAGHGVVVVVSAMGKTTDGLLRLADEVCQRSGAPAEAPRRELDMLVSTGERVAMALLSIAIQARGLDAISFTGSQCGIITNDRHFDARIIEVRPHRIEDELNRGRVVIVAGYQGMSYRREITTLGRGGSDTTAVALAAALEADRCEIYSDVDGVYSADPRVVPDAAHLPEVDYATLQQMAESGAKVVCAQAVEWARRAGVALYARSSFDASDESARHTLVRKFGPSEDGAQARAVVGDRGVVLVRAPGHGEALVAALAGTSVGCVELWSAGEGTTAVLSIRNAPDWSAVRTSLGQSIPGLSLREQVALISVVGGGLDGGALGRLAAALEGLGCRAHATQLSALRVAAVVDDEHAEPLQRALHDAFIVRG